MGVTLELGDQFKSAAMKNSVVKLILDPSNFLDLSPNLLEDIYWPLQ